MQQHEALSRLSPTPAAPPLRISDAQAVSWDDEADVVVVGFGGAGACAALEAHANGAEVLVLERHSGGGATKQSGGIFYAGQTHIQAAAGVEDSAAEMFNYLRQEVKDAVSLETLRDFCEQSADNLKWLVEHGVPFEASLSPVKTSYPTDKYYLYYSGNEAFSPYKDHAKPAPRGHRVRRPGVSGVSFFTPLQAQVKHRNIAVRTESRVERLIVDKSERVIGAEYHQVLNPLWRTLMHLLVTVAIGLRYMPDLANLFYRLIFAIERRCARPRRVRARRGIILAAGGYIANRQMMQEHAPSYMGGMPLGTVGDNGSGIMLGQSLGGALGRMNRATAWCFVNPPLAWAGGILVNKRGDRIINELLYGAAIGEAVIEQNDGVAILILDKELKRRSRAQCNLNEMQWFQIATQIRNLWFNCRSAKTLDELADRMGISREGLRATVAAYNQSCESGDDTHGKPASYLHKLESGPFFAIDCSRSNKHFVWPTLTLGGLVVDEQTGHVKREDGSRIEGLYAAGRSAVGICSQQYMSGLSLADCVYSGRRAGRQAAANESEQRLPSVA